MNQIQKEQAQDLWQLNDFNWFIIIIIIIIK